ncbi:hypothetical protein [Streptomyces sp. B1I3]|uniref:hypothetical protein n=1 Tax=Streptomyces sp. B1I3 TaxID=3042264 RepID=UPI002785EA90|nr:hypothetical protein [Streptomyces sp. B1I3]MDQ0796518.1 hypothetical protein [Streptomyces sp. B1I3]
MNNVRADGHGCPVYNRCFSCTFYTTDFTHLPEVRQLRAGRADSSLRWRAPTAACSPQAP